MMLKAETEFYHDFVVNIIFVVVIERKKEKTVDSSLQVLRIEVCCRSTYLV